MEHLSRAISLHTTKYVSPLLHGKVHAVGSFSLVATSKLCSWKSLFIILFCIREWVVYSYDPYMFTVIYLPARMDLPIMKCIVVWLMQSCKENLQAKGRKKFHGLTNPKMLSLPLR